MSQNLAATLARASDAARASGSGEVAIEHVLLALCDDPDAQAVLMASRVDIAHLKSDCMGFLRTLPPTAPGAPIVVSGALTRILEAAAAAARGGRRRDINGAIVLAAIVGDGRTVAAQLLESRGLTFDEAIRALQAALAPPGRDAVPDLRPADDVLAQARERVQSRSAPSLRQMMDHLPARTEVPPPAVRGTAIAGPKNADAATGGGAEGTTGQGHDAETASDTGVAADAVHEESTSEAPPADEAQPHDSKEAAGAPPSEAPSKPSPGYAYPSEATRPAAPARPPAPPPAPGHEQPGLNLQRPAPIAAPPPLPPPPPIPMRAPGLGGLPPSRGAPPRGPQPPSAPPQAFPQGSPRPPAPRNPGSPPADQYRPYGNTGYATAPPSMPPQTRPPGAQKPGRAPKAATELGQLAENIPRRMRVGVTERIEIRLAKTTAKAVAEGLEGGGQAWVHQVTVAKAMSVRLRAPEGGFFIETASPETQWIENTLDFDSDDFASWRFLVTPQDRGWTRLQIIVSARTIGSDGVAAETALPDQVVEVKVKTNFKRTFARWAGWITAAIVGGALAKFGEGGFEFIASNIQKFVN